MWGVKNQFVFYWPWKTGESEILLDSPSLVRQLTRVLRIKVGERLVFLNGKGGRALAVIHQISTASVLCQKIEEALEDPRTPSWHLIIGTPKKEALKEVLQMGTQWGVQYFSFVDSEYSQWKSVHYEKKRVNYEAVIIEALEQSGQLYKPNFQCYQSWEEFQSCYSHLSSSQVFVADLPHEDGGEAQKALYEFSFQGYDQYYLTIGPEGGWSHSERTLFLEWGWRSFTLHPNILRVQTAVIASLVAAQTLLDVQNLKLS